MTQTPRQPALRAIALMVSLPALACNADVGSTDRARYLTALDSGACAEVRSSELQDDCWLAQAAKPLERGDSVTARVEATCAHVTGERSRAECYFLIAEHTGSPKLCNHADMFKDDCGLHAVSMAFARNRTLTEAWAYEQIVASGMNPRDIRPWSAYFRELLSRSAPLDRAACAHVGALDGAPSATERQEACTQTGRALFEDRLNQARDQRSFTCVDSVVQLPVPERVRWAPDAELDAIFAGRTDLCTPLDSPPGGRR